MKIFLKDFKEAVFEEFKKRNVDTHCYSNTLFEAAFKIETDNNLRYDTMSGKTYSNEYNGIVEEFVYKKDIPVYDSNEEAAKWSFTGIVSNTASLINRGYINQKGKL